MFLNNIPPTKIRVLIVEDSETARTYLRYVIGRDPRLEVVGAVESGEEALRIVPRLRPDVISLDLHLPGMSGYETTRRIMAQYPTPIVVVTAHAESDRYGEMCQAVRCGAVSLIAKPAGTARLDYESMGEHLCNQLAIMSQVPVIRQRFPALALERTAERQPASLRSRHEALSATGAFDVMGIVASTGGPNALRILLGSLPSRLPVPIVVVQHMAPSFHLSFVRWLATICSLPVTEARKGDVPRIGHVYVAPPDCHLEIVQGAFALREGLPDGGPCPSGTIFFQSLARHFGDRILAVILTGMGRDGADGIRAIRDAGGYTIGEDASTSVVYGMPGAAAECGGLCESLPLPSIGPRVLQLLRGGFPDPHSTCPNEKQP